jgi:cytidylate kinase
MIITISGDPGSGKSTIAKAIASELGYKHYSLGDRQREVAGKIGISILELNKREEKDPMIDKDMDDWQVNLGENEDDFVIDSRIGFKFIPNSLKIFLKTDSRVAADRVFYKDIQNNKRKTENEKTYDEVLKAIIDRQQSERKRFKKYYKIDMLDMKNYDFVLDASKLTITEETQRVLDFIKSRMNK